LSGRWRSARRSLADGLYDFQFRLYDDPNIFDGNQVGDDVNVPDGDVIEGYFTVVLDFNDANAFKGEAQWLEIGVRPGHENDPNTYEVLSPRQEVTPTPYALYALNTAGLRLPYSGNVADGGPVFSIANSGSGMGISGAGSPGVFGESSSENGVVGESTASGYSGVYGHNPDGVGVRGRSENNDGVEGWTDANDKSGVYGYSSAGTGVTGRSEAAAGRGVFGKHVSSGNYGIVGDPNYGVYGTGSSAGVRGDSSSSDGVVGWTSNSNKSGVYGYSNAGIGVTGRSEATSGRGVFGKNVPTGNYGILGDPNYAAYGEHASGSYGYIGGSSYGVYGKGVGEFGAGVYGESGTVGVFGTGGSIGVQGGADGIGVAGTSTSGTGVSGSSGSGRGGYFTSSSGYGLIVEDGSVGIGTTSPQASGLHVKKYGGATAIYCQVLQQMPFATATGIYCDVFAADVGGAGIICKVEGDGGTGVDANGPTYDFYASGPGTDYGSASSVRWKSDIQPIDDALGKVLRLRGVYFDWDAGHGGHHDVGMVAEEVGEVLSEIVSYEQNGVDATGMDYSRLTPLLVEAVKALKTEVDELQGQIAARDAIVGALRERDKKMESRLAGMETLVARLSQQQEGGGL
jgi:hypothetical protein